MTPMNNHKKYKVCKINIHHNGKTYPEDSDIQLSLEEARHLLSLGFLKEIEDTEETDKTEVATGDTAATSTGTEEDIQKTVSAPETKTKKKENQGGKK